jgi:hypothetical protein
MQASYNRADLFYAARSAKQYSLLLLCIFMFQFCNAMPSTGTSPGTDTDTIPPQIFTVARVWEDPADTSAYKVVFLQSAKFYRLMRNNKNVKAALVLLQQSQKTNKPVKVYLTEQYGDIINYVKAMKK